MFHTSENVYIHPSAVDILYCFGDINTVVNKIIDELYARNVDIESCCKEPAPNQSGCRHYQIVINNADYNALRAAYPAKSYKVSLRRIINWFVVNEMYFEWGWEPIREYTSNEIDTVNKRINDVISRLNSLKLVIRDRHHDDIDEMIRKLSLLKR